MVFVSIITHNGAEICEVLKISERSEEKFSELRKSLVVRSAEAKRRYCGATVCEFKKLAISEHKTVSQY
jgi:hypothetical protein